MLVEIHQVHGKLRTDGDRWFYLVEFQVTADGADGVWNEGVDWAEIGRPLRRDFLEMLATDAVQDLELELTEEGDAVTRSPEFSIAWTGQDPAARKVVHELGFGRAGGSPAVTEYRAVAVVGLTRALAAGRLHVKPWLVAEGPEGYLLWASGSPGTELEPQASPAYLYELGDDLAGDIANDLERGGDVLDIPSGGVAQYWVGQDPESEQLLRSLGAN